MTDAASGPLAERWPDLPLDAWRDTLDTLLLWTQIVGKVRLVQSPWVNHSWHVTLYVTARGLTTSPVPHHRGTFQVDFDFVDHALKVNSSDGRTAELPLEAQSVADFYGRFMALMTSLELPVRIHPYPNEVAEPIRFDLDTVHSAYDPEYAHRFWRILLQADRVFKAFRAQYTGKCSPVHYFWGAADLAVTRFSGRTAPPHPGGMLNLPDSVTRDAYSHEVISCGFWAGGGPTPYPVFYVYAYPEPAGFAESTVKPEAAFYSPDLGEFVLPYAAVRESESPDEVVRDFLQSTYDAAADLATWDRVALERGRGP